MKPMKYKQLIKLLSSFGVKYVRSGKGSHDIYALGAKTACIPAHRVVSAGTLRGIFKSLDIDYKDLAS